MSALRATVEGDFFPDWEFQTLIGVDRNVVRNVWAKWPRQTVDRDEFVSAVAGSMVNLVGYPHNMDNELGRYVSGGRKAVYEVLGHLKSLGFQLFESTLARAARFCDRSLIMAAAPIHVGVGGWDFDPWRGTFYPAGLARTKQLEHLGTRL